MEYKVVYGDKVTSFVISKTKTGGAIEYSNNLGLKSSTKISTTDFDYLKDKVNKAKGPTNKLEFCRRSYIEVTTDKRKLMGCIGGQNTVARNLQSTVNLLSILF